MNLPIIWMVETTVFPTHSFHFCPTKPAPVSNMAQFPKKHQPFETKVSIPVEKFYNLTFDPFEKYKATYN